MDGSKMDVRRCTNRYAAVWNWRSLPVALGLLQTSHAVILTRNFKNC
jgi:hypothetical protein